MAIDDEDYICMNYKEGDCPYRCSWADCKDFVPSTYMKDSITTYMKGLKNENKMQKLY